MMTGPRYLWVPHLTASGVEQMALDEALLEWLPVAEPILIARTYSWNNPTLSLGVHQKEADSRRAYQLYAMGKPLAIVRRPTGGRAILHGQDISFAFITNSPSLVKLSLDESYCFFTTWIRQAIGQLGIHLQESCVEDKRAYTRSPLCFETKTPSDLQTPQGQKLAGSAQLRRQKGILQHGAAFLRPHGISPEAFSQALYHVIAASTPQAIETLSPESDETLMALWEKLKVVYRQEAETILQSVSTTSGSHLVPASD